MRDRDASGKPRKPWYRTRNLVLLVLVLFAAWAGRQVWWAFTAEPSGEHARTGEFPALIAEYRPDAWPVWGGAATDEDARALIVEAGERYRKAEEEMARRIEAEMPAYEDATERYVDVSNLLESNSPEFEHGMAAEIIALSEESGVPGALDRVMLARGFEREWSGPAIGIMLPELGTARWLTRYARARMHVKLAEGDGPEAVRSFAHGMAIARHLVYQPTTIDRLVGIAIRELMMSEVMYALVEREVDGETIAGFAEVARVYGQTPPLEYTLRSERLSALDMLDLFYTDNGREDGRLVYTAYMEFRNQNWMRSWGNSDGTYSDWLNLAGVVMPTRRETEAAIEEAYADLIRAAGLPTLERADEFRAFLNAWGGAKLNPVVRMILPAMSRVAESDLRSAAMVRAFPVVMAIERHIRRHGAPPATLADLDADLVPPEVAMGDLATGSAWVYTAQEPNAVDPRRYLLDASGLPPARFGLIDDAYNRIRPIGGE